MYITKYFESKNIFINNGVASLLNIHNKVKIHSDYGMTNNPTIELGPKVRISSEIDGLAFYYNNEKIISIGDEVNVYKNLNIFGYGYNMDTKSGHIRFKEDGRLSFMGANNKFWSFYKSKNGGLLKLGQGENILANGDQIMDKSIIEKNKVKIISETGLKEPLLNDYEYKFYVGNKRIGGILKYKLKK